MLDLVRYSYRLLSKDRNKTKLAIIAITDHCSNKCKMCGIWKKEPKHQISFEDFKKIVDNAMAAGFGSFMITGGDALFHKDILKFVDYLHERGALTQVVTNAVNITHEIASGLEGKVTQILVSLDSVNPEIFEETRQHKDVFYKVVEGIEILKTHDLPVCAIAVLIRDNVHDLEDTLEFCKNFGIGLSFCPSWDCQNNTTYNLGGDGKTVLQGYLHAAVVRRCIAMKKRDPVVIFNTPEVLEEILALCEGRQQKYPCTAGKNQIYIDTQMKIYPCFFRNDFVLDALDRSSFSQLRDFGCTRCAIGCFREPSILYTKGLGKYKFIARNASDFLKKKKAGLIHVD